MEKDCRFKCNFCDKVFSKGSNRTRHLKSVHHKNSQGEDVDRPSFTCVLCDKTYTAKSSLQQHIDAIHLLITKLNKCKFCDFQTSHRGTLYSHIKKVHTNRQYKKNKVGPNFSCSQCMKTYSHKKSLWSHERKIHKVNHPSIHHRKCPLCIFVSTSETQNEIHEHFVKAHEVQMKWEKHTFPNISEFVNWKDQLQLETSSTFIKIASWKPGCMYYTCNRRGYYKPKGTNKRHIKMSGTCKINAYCPAGMQVRISDSGFVSVSYIPTHVGHKHELKYMRLQAQDKKFIVTQLLSKIPHDEILKNTRQTLFSNNELKRIHLLNKKDLVNIEKSFNLNADFSKHEYDPLSIEAWVHELQSDNHTSLLIYKPQGICDEKYPGLNSQDFLLIYMTDAQKSLLTSFGRNILSIDGTHGVNSYNFQLYTLLTLDEGHEGVPCAFMFTNRGDELVLSLFFQSIKDVAGLIIPKVFMSDMEETFYSSWFKIMGPVGLRLFCTWHVLKAWRTNLCRIKNKEKKENTYKILKTILYELDCNTFHQILISALNKMQSDPDTKDYFDYFNDHYVKSEKFKCWAYCYRTHCGINTNMSLENFNRVLKYCYLKGKKVQRLDKTLHAILNLLRDKLFDYLIKVEKGKLVSKLQALRQRHKRGMLIPEVNVTKDGDKWYVVSVLRKLSTELYCVKKVQECRLCQLQCLHCNSCFHEYICTCMDNSIKNNMCKHIHAVCRTLKEERQDKEEENGLRLVIDANKDENNMNIKNSVIKEVGSSQQSDESRRQEIQQMALSLLNGDALVTSQDVNIAHKGLKGIFTSLNAVKVTAGRPIVNNSESDDVKMRKIKITPQRRFYSSKKKKQKTPNFTAEDQNRIALELLRCSNQN